MSPQLVKAGLAVGLLVLALALLVPTLIDATQEDTEGTVELSNNESAALTDQLEVQAHDINTSDKSSNVTLENRRTLASNTTSLNESETKTLELSGDTMTVSLDNVSDARTATITTTYPPMFGWNEGARLFMENLDVVLALLAVIAVLGALLISWGEL